MSIADQDDDASDEPFDALPIWDAIGGAAAAGAGGVLLSKGKEQVLSALSQASEAVASTSTPTPTDLAQEALDGALDRAHQNSENARAEVTAIEHFVDAAVASASSLAFGAATTNAGNKNVVAGVESAYEAALSSASSVLSDASVFMVSSPLCSLASLQDHDALSISTLPPARSSLPPDTRPPPRHPPSTSIRSSPRLEPLPPQSILRLLN